MRLLSVNYNFSSLDNLSNIQVGTIPNMGTIPNADPGKYFEKADRQITPPQNINTYSEASSKQSLYNPLASVNEPTNHTTNKHNGDIRARPSFAPEEMDRYPVSGSHANDLPDNITPDENYESFSEGASEGTASNFDPAKAIILGDTGLEDDIATSLRGDFSLRLSMEHELHSHVSTSEDSVDYTDSGQVLTNELLSSD
jgi:hypothetical protein